MNSNASSRKFYLLFLVIVTSFALTGCIAALQNAMIERSVANMPQNKFKTEHNLKQNTCRAKTFYGYEDNKIVYFGSCDQDGYGHGKGVIEWQSKKFKVPEDYVKQSAWNDVKDRVYFGNLTNGVPTGSGEFIFSGAMFGSTDFHYQGSIANGVPDGEGTEFFTRSQITGDENKTEGDKKWITIKNRTQPDSVKYKGDWKKGIKHGYGVEYFNFCNRYVGPFVDGKRDGAGTLIIASKETVIKEDLGRTMHTKMKWEKGMSYTGLFKDDKPLSESPMCEIGYATGEIYRGSCKDFKRHGKGIMVGSSGNVLTNGEWEHDHLTKDLPTETVPTDVIAQLYFLVSGGIQRGMKEAAFKNQFQQYNFAFTVIARSIGLIDSCSDPFSEEAYEKYKKLSEIYNKINILKGRLQFKH